LALTDGGTKSSEQTYTLFEVAQQLWISTERVTAIAQANGLGNEERQGTLFSEAEVESIRTIVWVPQTLPPLPDALPPPPGWEKSNDGKESA